MSENSILVTYFGAFKHFQENPAELVAKKLKLVFSNKTNVAFKKLEVTYESINRFLESDLNQFDHIIELGVATKSEKVKLELVGRNFVNGHDNKGHFNFGSIDKKLDSTVETIFPNSLIECTINQFPNSVISSYNAGSYLCNYIYFRSLSKFTNKRILFVHLANFIEISNAVIFEQQVEVVQLLIAQSEKLNKPT